MIKSKSRRVAMHVSRIKKKIKSRKLSMRSKRKRVQ